MRLIEVIRDLDQFSEESTIFAAEPWTSSSAAAVANEPNEGGMPQEALELAYFLEVAVAVEFLEGWLSERASVPCLEDQCARLIDYAINDA